MASEQAGGPRSGRRSVLGFVEIAPYHESPMDDVVYLELSLG